MCETLRNPEGVLKTLSDHSHIASYKYERLYRNLFNERMFHVAYQRIYAKPGNMTPGTDGKTIDQMSTQRIDRVIASLRNETYQPHPARRVYIPKKNGKKRPLGIPSFEDKLVQEVVRMMLEAIYEGQFESSSHGFRPSRSCHTALAQLQRTFSGAKWFIEGDIKGFFDNIDHDVLIGILRERIADERFLRLIRKFLKAGYIEDWKYNSTYSGTPQGGIISPILANVYLDKFDKYIKEYSKSFSRGKQRHINNEYARLNTQRGNLKKRLRTETDEMEIAEINRLLKEKRDKMLSMPVKDAMDPDFRRMQYVRYADDFLIAVIGSKAECEEMKADIAKFMTEHLRLELSDEKTLITNAQDKAKFLGYEISIRKSNALKRNEKGQLKREFNGSVVLSVNMETARKKLDAYGALKIEKAPNGKDFWQSKAREYMIGMRPEEILAQYNGEIRGFYNYFSLAGNTSAVCSKFGYIMEWSMYKTLGQKLNLSSMQVKRKYRKDKDFVIPYKDSKGDEKYRILYNGGFKRKTAQWNAAYDTMPQRVSIPYPSLAERLMDGVCEMCGSKGKVVMHHVRNLNLLKGENEWERLMLKRRRKTLVVCEACNALIHRK